MVITRDLNKSNKLFWYDDELDKSYDKKPEELLIIERQYPPRIILLNWIARISVTHGTPIWFNTITEEFSWVDPTKSELKYKNNQTKHAKNKKQQSNKNLLKKDEIKEESSNIGEMLNEIDKIRFGKNEKEEEFHSKKSYPINLDNNTEYQNYNIANCNGIFTKISTT